MTDLNKLSELQLYKWQQASKACIHAGKNPGEPWTMQIIGVCPITKMDIHEMVQGQTIKTALEALVNTPRMQQILLSEEVKKYVDSF